LALVYVWIKLTEYRHLIDAGLGLERSTFFTLYWIVTGFHFLHVLLGLVILAWLGWRCWQRQYLAPRLSGLESGVLYWHMVDLVWVVLFALVYVIR
jgi:nitric oxide reductase NorE protein